MRDGSRHRIRIRLQRREEPSDRWSRYPLAIAASASLIVFAVVAVLVMLRATRSFDLAATQALQSIAAEPLDLLANADTLIGQASVSAAIVALLAYVLWRRGPRLAWVGAGLFVIVGVVELTLKLVLVHPPPPEQYVRAIWNPLGVSVPTPSGFPSGHIARVTFVALFAAAVVRMRAVRTTVAAIVVVTLWARVYIGHHWLSDAVGGLTLGTAAGCLALIWIEWRRAYDRHP
jgi:undecaprenyl-diphosphatase